MTFRYLLLFCLSFVFFGASFGQNYNGLSFGNDDQLEVLTWNIEHFPKRGGTTLNYVEKAIRALDVDVIAVQEIDEPDKFEDMMDRLKDDYGYSLYSTMYRGLAYIYKKSTVKVNSVYDIYNTGSFKRQFPRYPLVLDFEFKGENYIVINNHYKCCGDGYINPSDDWDEETRRASASRLLKKYIDDYFADKKVFVVGDMNDEITEVPSRNVFQDFLDDSDHYRFADMSLAQGSSDNWSFPTWPSHLDHILVNKPMFEALDASNTVIQTIQFDEYLNGGWHEYDTYVSDHRPTAIRFTPVEGASVEEINTFAANFKNYPNPFTHTTTFEFLPLKEDAQMIIYNQNGQQVEVISLQQGQQSAQWDCAGMDAGVYCAQMISEGDDLARIKLLLMR